MLIFSMLVYKEYLYNFLLYSKIYDINIGITLTFKSKRQYKLR